jgi:flagellar capping protein FliD
MIVKTLMEMERQPLTCLEDDKKLQEIRLDTFKTYHDKLSALNTAGGALYLSSSRRESRVSLSSKDYISANVTSAQPGTYKVAVEQLDNGNEDGDRYYLVLSGTDSSMEFTMESNLIDGTESLEMQKTQEAQKAVVHLDGIRQARKAMGKNKKFIKIEKTGKVVNILTELMREEEGSGMDFAIVRKKVSRHDATGRKGTTFFYCLL